MTQSPELTKLFSHQDTAYERGYAAGLEDARNERKRDVLTLAESVALLAVGALAGFCCGYALEQWLWALL